MDFEDNNRAKEREHTISDTEKANTSDQDTSQDDKKASRELNMSSMGVASNKHTKGNV